MRIFGLSGLLLCTLLIGVAPGAIAQSQSPFYLVGTVGKVNHAARLPHLNLIYGLGAPGFDTATLSDSGDAYKLGLGYRLNQTFSVEASYGRLGKTAYNVNRVGGGLFRLNIEPEVWEVAAVAGVPLGNSLRLFGKLGAAHVKNKGDIIDLNGFCPNGGIVCGPGSTSNDTILSIGAGLSYQFQKNVFLRAEWEYYDNYKAATAPDLRPVFGPAAQTGGEVKVRSDVLSIGIGYNF